MPTENAAQAPAAGSPAPAHAPVFRSQTGDAASSPRATPGQIAAWLLGEERLHQARTQAPLPAATLEDPTLLEDHYRSAALWDRISEARANGALSPALQITLDQVRPKSVPAEWFALAHSAGVCAIALDTSSMPVNNVFASLVELRKSALAHGITPRFKLPLAGPGIDVTESASRTVIFLKNEIPWEPVVAALTPEQRRDLTPQLGAAVEQGTADPVLLCDLVLGPWLRYLPAANRRALFPVWMSANHDGQIAGSYPTPAEALDGLHSTLRPAFKEWLRARLPPADSQLRA